MQAAAGPRGMRKAASSVDDYIEAFPSGRQRTLKTVRATIRKAAPDAVEGISYGMPGYKLEGALVYFAGFKDHWSLFALPQAQTVFKKELAPYRTTKGTAQFPWDEPVPVRLIARITKYRAQENRADAEAKRSAKDAAKGATRRAAKRPVKGAAERRRAPSPPRKTMRKRTARR